MLASSENLFWLHCNEAIELLLKLLNMKCDVDLNQFILMIWDKFFARVGRSESR